MNIKEHLIKYGYNLDYSYNDDLCSEALVNALGGMKKYRKFWKTVDAYKGTPLEINIEKIIRNLLVDNQVAIKVMLSGQIAISVAILKEIISYIKKYMNINSKNVLELGGYDGWAAHFITNNIEGDYVVDVVDEISGLSSLSSRVNLITSSYEDYSPSKKYNLVYSILGAHFDALNTLFECATNCIEKDGFLLLGLRVQPNKYKEIQQRMVEKGFSFSEDDLVRVKVDLDRGTQYLPVFCFKKI